MGVLPEYLLTIDVCITHKGQKRELDPLELELDMVVSHHVGAVN